MSCWPIVNVACTDIIEPENAVVLERRDNSQLAISVVVSLSSPSSFGVSIARRIVVIARNSLSVAESSVPLTSALTWASVTVPSVMEWPLKFVPVDVPVNVIVPCAEDPIDAVVHPDNTNEKAVSAM